MSDPTRLATRELRPIPEQRLNDLLAGRSDLQLAVAESCTGGEIGHRITAIAGSSDYFQGSLVTYSNLAKTNLLGVQTQILESVGAVSEACAREMAEGARRAFRAEIAVSTTGIAGPGGATARKPVGLVYIGLATPGGAIVEQHIFPGNRRAVVDAAAERALELLVDAVERRLASPG